MTAEDVGEDMCPVFVGYDNDSHGIGAVAADAKGATKPSVQWVKGKVDEAGCSGTPISLRSDQDESIMALKRAVAIYRPAEIIMLESPVRDSKANGAAERAVRSWAGQLRTIRHHVERTLKVSIPKDSAMISWLVSWAADVNSTGRTSHKWVTGHRCDQPATGFPKKIHFKFTIDKNHRHKIHTEWSTGCFVGTNWKTTEYLVATSEGIFSCATIRRLPDDEAYDPECIQLVKITYHDSVLEGARSTPVGVRFGDAHNKNANSDPTAAPMMPRRARLQPGDFQNFGYTVGCPGCDQFQIGGSTRRSRTEECRNRIEGELKNTDLGKD